VGIEVLKFDPIWKWKATTTIIFGLSGSKLCKKDILAEYVIVKVQEVFMIDVVVPYENMIGDT
jgi:hypothetical protein